MSNTPVLEHSVTAFFAHPSSDSIKMMREAPASASSSPNRSWKPMAAKSGHPPKEKAQVAPSRWKSLWTTRRLRKRWGVERTAEKFDKNIDISDDLIRNF